MSGTLIPVNPRPPFDPRNGALISGRAEDARMYKVFVSLGAGEERVIDIGAAQAIYIDEGTLTLGDVSISFDVCNPYVVITRGVFLRTQEFHKIRVRSNGPARTVGIVYSNNPDFLVFAGFQ